MPDPTEPCACGDPASHHRRRDDGTFAESLIDQTSCTGYRPASGPPNWYVLPDQPMAAAPGFDIPQPDTGPGQPSGAPDADLTDVLINYDEVFQAVHGRYIRLVSELMQEVAELRAGFNQAVARMREAEAKLEALQG